MKKIILSIITGTLILFAAIAIVKISNRYQHIAYISSTTPEKCYICGDSKKFSGMYYWGEDNVGIVNLNTFELMRLEVVRYDGYGNRVTETAGYMSSSSLSAPETETYVHAFTFPDNDFSDVTFTGVKYAIDRKSIQRHLCQRCLDTINNLDFSGQPPAEFAILNFKERTIHPLHSSCAQLESGNYRVDCEYKSNDTIDLLVQYCSHSE